MKSHDGTFYKSKAWRNCREEYLRLHPFCEECLKEKKYTPATHVHHKIILTTENINDPKITLCFDNLEAVCMECHNHIHFGKSERRYTVDEYGRVSPL